MSGSKKINTGGHGGDLAACLERFRPAGGKLIDFSSNINPLGAPKGLKEHLVAALPGISAYPAPLARDLTESLSQFFNVSLANLIAGNGANDLIHQLIAWLKPGRVFVPAPSFSEYARAARFSSLPLSRYNLPPVEAFDPEKLAARLKKGDLVIFCNPNNPSGLLEPRAAVLFLVEEAARKGAMLLIDESFMLFTGKPKESFSNCRADNLWVVTSLTKIWGLPGLRLGYALGPETLVKKFTRWQDPWKVNYLAQVAGIYCCGAKGFIEETVDFIGSERAFLKEALQQSGRFTIFNSAANYLLLRSESSNFKVARFQEDLAKKGLLIRRADNFRGLDQRYLRLCVRKREDNLELLQETESWFSLKGL